jgi:hypothetical protein
MSRLKLKKPVEIEKAGWNEEFQANSRPIFQKIFYSK